MVFVDSISELNYYHTSPQWGCYGDAVFVPSDILLQANGFTATGSIGITINVCDITGAFQEDGTSYFYTYFASFMIGGVTYYFLNIRANGYSPFMEGNRCFVLNVVITDATNGTVVFNKWTQKYNIITVTTDSSAWVEALYIDNVLTAPCVAGDNPALCSAGGEQYVNFTATFDCYDAYTGYYYAEGSPILGSYIPYTHSCNLYARFRDLPTEVERVISINNRTQKTAYNAQYVLTGKEWYPVWKMKEIQYMLRASNLYIDGNLFQSKGGVVFTQVPGVPVGCTYMYTMSIPFQGNFEWQIFGCVPNCEDLASYYLFPREYDLVYDDSMRVVASTPDELVTYFISLGGASVVEEVPFYIPCQPYSTIKVISTATLPPYLYYDNPIPSQRVYPKQLAANATDLSSLCNGVTSTNQIVPPDITGVDDEEIQVPVPDITGVEDVSANYYNVQITAAIDWDLALNPTSGVNYEGVGTLNISISTDDFTPPYVNMTLANILQGAPSRDIQITSTNNGNMPPSSTLTISQNGAIIYSGQETNEIAGTYYVELFNIKYPL